MTRSRTLRSSSAGLVAGIIGSRIFAWQWSQLSAQAPPVIGEGREARLAAAFQLLAGIGAEGRRVEAQRPERALARGLLQRVDQSLVERQILERLDLLQQFEPCHRFLALNHIEKTIYVPTRPASISADVSSQPRSAHENPLRPPACRSRISRPDGGSLRGPQHPLSATAGRSRRARWCRRAPRTSPAWCCSAPGRKAWSAAT